ncbi:DprA-like DNA processing chain A [Gordonia phage Bosnia]|uniref:DprA-like DNA processing chain A n=1 Tax=Gordonia phage Bosnia TaxID=2776839 RepID=A0A7L8ZDZ6_9CAUD|nr:DprA-like DNA processing chain A [Gordonia phage Bosnia]QOI66871.1 DprA-like DNA processing chain A [Gordonia phage Bosnia]
MNDDHIALVALTRTRPGGMTWRQITEQVLATGSAIELWNELQPSELDLAVTTEPAVALAKAADDLEEWRSQGLEFVSVLDDRFPARLRDIQETPPFLFAQGLIDDDDQGVSVVGSRKASRGGLDFARETASRLVGEGLSVVAGLALGIDTAAHSAALASGGRTVAFVATGLDRTYPKENRELHAAIADTGLMLSQFLPGGPPQRHNFLMRNALMSGYGLATIVVEAGEHSGARAQARMAVQHGRPVILTTRVVDSNEWAKRLQVSHDVYVVGSPEEAIKAVREIREEPHMIDLALDALVG